MAKWLHVGHYAGKGCLNKLICYGFNSNEALRLQPPVPSGSQRSVNKGEGAKVLEKL